jgi:TatD DNase family protein
MTSKDIKPDKSIEKPLFDTHLHPPTEGNIVEYAEAARQAGVKWLLAVGADAEEGVRAQSFAASVPGAWFSAGIHPHAAADWDGEMTKFAEYTDDDQFVAVGEIGLDYYYENSPPEIQRRVLARFLEFAFEVGRPVILHCRDREGNDDAYRDLYAALDGFPADGQRAVLHCYSETVAWAEKFVSMGLYLGVTGIVTFPKGDNVREVVRQMPMTRLLLETDSPYLAPVPHRGRTNHPRYLPEIAQRVAAELNLTVGELAVATTANAGRLFGIEKLVGGDR